MTFNGAGARENMLDVVKKNEELFEQCEELKLQAQKWKDTEKIAIKEVDSFKELVKNQKLKNENQKNSNEEKDLKIEDLQKESGELRTRFADSTIQNEKLNKEIIELNKYKTYWEGTVVDSEIDNFKYIKDNFPVNQQGTIFYEAILMLKGRLTRKEREEENNETKLQLLTKNIKKLEEKNKLLLEDSNQLVKSNQNYKDWIEKQKKKGCKCFNASDSEDIMVSNNNEPAKKRKLLKIRSNEKNNFNHTKSDEIIIDDRDLEEEDNQNPHKGNMQLENIEKAFNQCKIYF